MASRIPNDFVCHSPASHSANPRRHQIKSRSPTMAKKVNVAIIGLGFGAEFIPIYQNHPNANIYAICQRNAEKMKKVGDEFKIDKRYTSYDDVLKDPAVDYVHINSPIPDHAPLTIAALKAAKHVMCT